MKNKPVLYIIFFVLLMVVFLLFNSAYNSLNFYSSHVNRLNTIHNRFQSLSSEINKAALLPPRLANHPILRKEELFVSTKENVAKELQTLRAAVKDTLNIRITNEVERLLAAELDWLINSNVPDSIINNLGILHIDAFKKINNLLQTGIERTSMLVAAQKIHLNKTIRQVNALIIVFVVLSSLLLVYTTLNFFKQKSKREQKERELVLVLNRIKDGVISVDRDWRYTFLNDAAMITHPLGREETLGRSIWDVHPEMMGTIFWDKYHEAMQTNNIVEIESYYKPMDTWFSVKIYPSEDGLTIFYSDISQSKKAEQRLTETLKEVTDYKFALDESSIVAITDQKGIIRHANPNFCKISKYSLEELIGQDHRIINSGYHTKKFIRNLWTTIANGNIWKGEMKNRAKDGTIYWVDTTIVPLLNEQGRPSQYLAIRADITERKKAEEEIILLNSELEEKVIKRTEELQLANKEMEAFTYSVSHDLRAPLRGIVGFTSILEEDYGTELTEEAKRITGVIKTNTLKMGRLIDDLLAFSRMGKQDIQKTTLDMNRMVTEIVHDLELHQPPTYPIEWSISELPEINADMNTIRQVWINLLSNAVKYSSNNPAPQIAIDAEEKNNSMIFSIKDNGVGFDEKYSNKLFKVFQRLHDSEEFEGTGVGLALVEKIISKHGGKVWAEGQPGKGASFYFSLPI